MPQAPPAAHNETDSRIQITIKVLDNFQTIFIRDKRQKFIFRISVVMVSFRRLA